jgi:hypothetical protein
MDADHASDPSGAAFGSGYLHRGPVEILQMDFAAAPA